MIVISQKSVTAKSISDGLLSISIHAVFLLADGRPLYTARRLPASVKNNPIWSLVVSMDQTASRGAFSSEPQACVLADRGTQQAHTDGGMPELLLKSPASSP